MAVVGPDPRGAPNRTYYADNFGRIVDTVAARYADLLEQEERAFGDDLRTLSLPARCLYVRLVSRVGPWFRRHDLHYDEIPQLEAAIEELVANRFLGTAAAEDPACLLPHLLRAELDGIARELGVAVGRATKRGSIDALVAACDAAALRAAILERVPLVCPLRLDLVRLHRLLFFGNLHQDMSELVLADLGVWRYESYELRRELRLFPTRAAIDDALAVRAVHQRVRERLEAGNGRGVHAAALEVARRDPPWHPTSRAAADSILLEVGLLLERAGAREEALELYAAATAPPARERCARLHARLGRERRAIALCREIAAAPGDESERLFAARFEQRLRRNLGQIPPRRRSYRRAHRLVLAPDRGRAVEDLALAHYAARGQSGFHAENWLWLALYGLAFWDVMFAPVAGAFEHPYQDGPLDLEDTAFRSRRAGAIAERLAELERSAWPADRLLEVWDRKHGIRNRLVPWTPPVRDRLALALSRLSGRHLATVLDRLSRDLGRYRRGLPDLFVLAPGAPGFVLLEVKSPGDRLRPEQIAWLDYLAESGVPCSVLAVEWSKGAGHLRFAAVESPQ